MNVVNAGLWFATLKARAIVAASILAAISAAWFGWLSHHDKKVEAKLVQRSVEAGKEANAKNAEVRRKSDTPDALGRLLKSACRDCE